VNLERIGGWLALIANVGVLTGLILVAYELRQNNQMLRAQASASRLEGTTAAETAFMGDDTAEAMALALTAPEYLTDAQVLQLWAYLNSAMIAVQQTATMHDLGLATEDDRHAAVADAHAWLSWPFGRVFWGEMRTNYPPGLAQEIDAALDADPDYLLDQFENMRKGAAALSR